MSRCRGGGPARSWRVGGRYRWSRRGGGYRRRRDRGGGEGLVRRDWRCGCSSRGVARRFDIRGGAGPVRRRRDEIEEGWLLEPEFGDGGEEGDEDGVSGCALEGAGSVSHARQSRRRRDCSEPGEFVAGDRPSDRRRRCCRRDGDSVSGGAQVTTGKFS